MIFWYNSSLLLLTNTKHLHSRNYFGLARGVMKKGQVFVLFLKLTRHAHFGEKTSYMKARTCKRDEPQGDSLYSSDFSFSTVAFLLYPLQSNLLSQVQWAKKCKP